MMRLLAFITLSYTFVYMYFTPIMPQQAGVSTNIFHTSIYLPPIAFVAGHIFFTPLKQTASLLSAPHAHGRALAIA